MLANNERGVSIVEATIVFGSLVLVAFFGWQVYAPAGRQVQASARFAGSASGVVQTAATNNIFLTRNEDGTISINNNGATAAELVRIARTIANDAGVGVCTGIIRFGSLVVGRCSDGTTPASAPASVMNTTQAGGQEAATLVAWQSNNTRPEYIVAKIANAVSAGRSSGGGGGIPTGPVGGIAAETAEQVLGIGYVGRNNQGGGRPPLSTNTTSVQPPVVRTNPQSGPPTSTTNTTEPPIPVLPPNPGEQSTYLVEPSQPIQPPGIGNQPPPAANGNPSSAPPSAALPRNNNIPQQQPGTGSGGTVLPPPESGFEVGAITPEIVLGGEGTGSAGGQRSLALSER